jgi:hypothetical protein
MHNARKGGANVARSNDADRFAKQIKPHQTVQKEVSVPDPTGGANQFPVESEQKRGSVFGDRMRGVFWDTRYSDAQTLCSAEIDIIKTSTTQGNHPDSERSKHLQGLGIDPVVYKNADSFTPCG